MLQDNHETTVAAHLPPRARLLRPYQMLRNRSSSPRIAYAEAKATDYTKKVRRADFEDGIEKDDALQGKRGAREPSSSGVTDRGKFDGNSRSRQQAESQDPLYSSYSNISGRRSYGDSSREDSRHDMEKDWQAGTDRWNLDKGYRDPGKERNRMRDYERDVERDLYGKGRDSRDRGRSRDREKDRDRDRERNRDKEKDRERGRESNHGGRDVFGPDNDIRRDKVRDRSWDRDRDKSRSYRTEYNDTDDLKDRDRRSSKYDYRGQDHYRDKDAQKDLDRDRVRYKDDRRHKDHFKERADYVERDQSRDKEGGHARVELKAKHEEGSVHEYLSSSQRHHSHGKEKRVGARVTDILTRDDGDEKRRSEISERCAAEAAPSETKEEKTKSRLLKGLSTDDFRGGSQSTKVRDIDDLLDCKQDSASKASGGDGRSSKNTKWGPEAQRTSENSSENVSTEDIANDLSNAKLAAMKAAELVNKNLGVAGFMSADQKKKLLWGAKKTIKEPEPVVAAGTNRWDTVHFADRSRQEKFNKLMGVKAEVKADCSTQGEQETNLFTEEKQRELQQDLEKQFTAGLRRRDGRTVGLGL
ncbi:hypothetical protein O6H91_11G011600 [Diphasiastrum complanatum]|uniref:Uncharacterized protein n=1 Tax=Diphasiastrum complanatum TaxID=34168 RepID=A0ACC2C6J3_DIPCM|nr:hypothetical protein O6H91_11G011600 [Diphasiastrum complanatum]